MEAKTDAHMPHNPFAIFQKKCLIFFRTKLVWVGSGSGSGLWLRLGLLLVSKVVFWAFFYISLLITLETGGPHQIPRFLYFILDNNPFIRPAKASLFFCRHDVRACTIRVSSLNFKLFGPAVLRRTRRYDASQRSCDPPALLLFGACVPARAPLAAFRFF